ARGAAARGPAGAAPRRARRGTRGPTASALPSRGVSVDAVGGRVRAPRRCARLRLERRGTVAAGAGVRRWPRGGACDGGRATRGRRRGARADVHRRHLRRHRASGSRVTTAPGVLTDRDLRDAVREGWIAPSAPPADEQFQPASLDLRLGPVAYQLRASFLPYRETPLLYDDDDRVLPLERVAFNDGLCMGIDLSGRATGGVIGYRAHPNPPAVDLARVGHYDPSEFWEPIKAPARDGYILEANRFYILVSKERIRVPPEFAAEMVVYDAGAGEIRTHYAGFFDPGFGFGDGSVLGTKVVMEVRAREVPFLIYDGQTSFKVGFERLRSRPDRVYGVGLASTYQ